MYLNDTYTLNFIVSLASKNPKTRVRRFFQFETSSVGEDGNTYHSIKRSMNFYFVIQNREVFDSSFLIRPNDAELLGRIIESKVLPWFIGNKKESAFQIVNNQLALKEYTPVYYTQSEYKYIIFTPIVYPFEDGSYSQGVCLELSSGDKINMLAETLITFYRFLKTDMYAVASSMVNYVKIPPYGINEYKAPQGLGYKPTESTKNIEQSYFGNSNSFLSNAKVNRQKGDD
jgi:hypothetical protein